MKPAIRSRLKHPLTAPVLYTNYLLGHYRDIIWLIGDGRSGTTWVSSLINYRNQYREMFEPFHPLLVKDVDCMVPHQYMRPDDNNPRLLETARRVFSGRLLHHRVDRYSRGLRHEGLVIKDIFANLLAYWALHHFPDMRIILLIRNPFAVALSKSRKNADWFWSAEPLRLLDQKALHEDYLQPFEDLIRTTSSDGDTIQKLILNWAIIHYVPLRQFSPEQINILFYEDVLVSPEREMGRILAAIGTEQPSRAIRIPAKTIKRPSRVAGRESTLMTGHSPVDAWKNELTAQQIDNGYSILARFGLDALYNGDSLPDRQVLEGILKSP